MAAPILPRPPPAAIRIGRAPSTTQAALTEIGDRSMVQALDYRSGLEEPLGEEDDDV